MTAPRNKATLVDAFDLSEDVKGLRFNVEDWTAHIPGQYYSIRLVSKEGYIAERSYSAANDPSEKGVVEFGVEFIENGEVSPFLWKLRKGQEIELKGPLGSGFTWDGVNNAPIILIAAGSGIVPFMSMLRYFKKISTPNSKQSITLLGSFKTKKHILYSQELNKLKKTITQFKLFLTLTKTAPDGWQGFTSRIDLPMLKKVIAGNLITEGVLYVSGPTLFVESVVKDLLSLGIHESRIKVERFG